MLKVLSILLLLLAGQTAFAGVEAIQKISGESSESNSMISVVFDQTIDAKNLKIEAHGSFIQVSISDSIVSEPGKFYDGNSPLVRKIAAFQIAETTVGIRLFVTQEASRVLPAVSTDFLGDRLSILIDHAKVSTKADKPPFRGVPSLNEVIENTKVESNATDPAKPVMVGADSHTDQDKGFGLSVEQLKEKLIPLAIFSAIMLAGLLVLASLRRIRQGAAKALDAHPVTMKTLASYNLAPKQKLTLIEVSGEKILLGVTPDQINYLTSIKAGEKPQSYGSRSRQILNHVASQVESRQSSTGTAARQDLVSPKSEKDSRQQPKLPKSTGADRKQEPVQSDRTTATKGRRISYAVGDDGINPVNTSRKQSKPPVQNQEDTFEEPKSIEDVTNLIRRKLQDLPKIDG